MKLFKLLSSAVLVASLGVSTLSASNQPAKPFLIQGKLPHLSGMVKILWDDEDLALSPAQQEKLLVIRKETMKQAKALFKKINALESEIVEASMKGATADSLEKKVYKLAKLRADATMVHLKCIYKTRKILSKEQLEIIE